MCVCECLCVCDILSEKVSDRAFSECVLTWGSECVYDTTATVFLSVCAPVSACV